MNYAPALESRPCAPIVLPDIPRCEIAMPMPLIWIDRLREQCRPDPGYAVSLICCRALAYDLPCRVRVNEDFPRIWNEVISSHTVPSDAWGVCPIPIRADVWHCVETAAAMVNRPAHEVFLKVLARQLSVWEGEEREKQRSHPAAVHAVPGKLIAGPWKPRPFGSD